ncbi:hypothetical protein [Psychroflexus halocasei]|uniref:Spheroidene monooxygenase n=1 Tax=Psychroflexus halocasei TaxID=908615 RepID=A0A1H4AZI5_9FLAO|nr:hypothetical protein [Psychroflexus halocasei]SEA41207.1 hypothetical protein SAMN05421540_105199 [Psychroflexus halocasei]
MSDYVTFSVFKFDNTGSKYWALSQMQLAHTQLKKVKGQSFYKLMGSGQQGFKPWPDFSSYALLQVWDSKEAAKDFLDNSVIFKKYKNHSKKITTYFLQAFKARGQWNQKSIFKVEASQPDRIEEIVSLTRASVNKRKIFKFWKTVPAAQLTLNAQTDLIYAKGFGEYPLTEMATFSHWKTYDAMRKYAYKSKGHQQAIKATRKNHLFKEEMFASFRILKIETC